MFRILCIPHDRSIRRFLKLFGSTEKEHSSCNILAACSQVQNLLEHFILNIKPLKNGKNTFKPRIFFETQFQMERVFSKCHLSVLERGMNNKNNKNNIVHDIC